MARQAADVDLLSGGRPRLGVGVGWNYVEYDALAQDFRTRGARQAEQVELLGRLFTEPVVDVLGRFDRVDRASLVPKPARPIPIWLGGPFGALRSIRAKEATKSSAVCWLRISVITLPLATSKAAKRSQVPLRT